MNEFLINVMYGVAIGFRNAVDRMRYLNDPYTSSGFVPCTKDEANSYVLGNDLHWELPRCFHEGTLDGLELMYSAPNH